MEKRNIIGLSILITVLIVGFFSINVMFTIFEPEPVHMIQYAGTILQDDYGYFIPDWQGRSLITSSVVTLGDYTVSINLKPEQECNKYNACWWNCLYYYTIKKGSIIIEESEEWFKQDVRRKLVSVQGTKNFDVEFNQMIRMSSQEGDCHWISNNYYFNFTTDDFIITTQSPDNTIQVGKNRTYNITINNKYTQGAMVDIVTKYTVPTIIGDKSKEVMKQETLSLGENILEYTVPADKATRNLQIEVVMDVLEEGSYFNGINGYCYETDSYGDLSLCSYVKVGTTVPEIFTVNITEDFINGTIDPDPEPMNWLLIFGFIFGIIVLLIIAIIFKKVIK